jgi:hypothetical protein
MKQDCLRIPEQEETQLYLLVKEHHTTIRHKSGMHCGNSGLTDDVERASIWCSRCRARARSEDSWSAQAVARLTTGSAMGGGVTTCFD